jgi:hypothetical protein
MHDSRTHDPWRERLSEYVDDELAVDERAALEAHLETCGECAALVEDLRRLVAAARELPDRAPETDPWPALRAAITAADEDSAPSRPRRTVRSLAWAFAAGVLVTLAGWLAFGRSKGTDVREPTVAGGSYLLLLHEPEGFASEGTPAEHAAVVEQYASWARGLGARCVGGEELAPEGWEISAAAQRERASGPGIGGFFLVQAADADEALHIARTCPHLDRGGSIELRPIRTHATPSTK